MSQVAQDPSAQARAKWIAAKISDKTLRDAFIRAVADKTLDYSDAERKQIQEGLEMEAEVTNSSALKPIKMSNPLLDKAVAMTSKDGQHNIVQASATVRASLIKETAELDADGQDARALGQLLVHEMEPVRTKKRPEELEAKLHVFLFRTTVLRELTDGRPWFEALLHQVLLNEAQIKNK
ncbi:hypothetical protein TeGR_g5170, partial [Tetraparma gracilis]